MFDSVKNMANKAFQAISVPFRQVPTQSTFLETGTLIPQEYVIAGDKLISVCNDWKWQKAVNENLMNKNLPANKQYLLLTDIRSSKRVKELIEETQTRVKESECEDDWMKCETLNQSEKIINLDEENKQSIEVQKDHFQNTNDQEENKQKDNAQQEVVQQPDEIRYYDLSIIYHQHYLVPCLYLYGKKDNGSPLTHEEIFEDIMAEYSNKTVTIEQHPHTGVSCVMLHPCKHANVLKIFCDTIKEGGGNVGPHLAILLFLKFLGSVIPTIQYDYTLEINMSETN